MIVYVFASILAMHIATEHPQTMTPVPRERLEKLLVGKQIVFPPPDSVIGRLHVETFRTDGLHTRSQDRGGETSNPYRIEAGKYCVAAPLRPYCVRVYETSDHRLFATYADGPRDLSEFAVQDIQGEKGQ